MGKRKQSLPKRNPNASVEERLEATKRRRRIIIEEGEDEVPISVSADESDKVAVVEERRDSVSIESGKSRPIQPLNQSLTEGPKAKSPLHVLAAQAVQDIFSDNHQATRKVHGQQNIAAIANFLLDQSGSKKNSLSILPAILDFGMLELYISRHNKSETSNQQHLSKTLHCILRQSFRLPTENNLHFQVYFYLTKTAFQQANPTTISTYLLGIKTLRSKRKELHATLALRNALATLFPKSLIDAIQSDPSGANAPPVQARLVYSLVDNTRFQDKIQQIGTKKTRTPTSISIPGLRPTLRTYQYYAVEWMISREQNHRNDNTIWEVCWLVIKANSPLMSLTAYRKAFPKDSLQDTSLLNPFTGALCRTLEEARVATVGSNYAGVRGGILSDSMGLGKTVELLACIMANPRPSKVVRVSNRMSLKAASCKANIPRNDKLIRSRGTLIITPPAILEQWTSEIRRHCVQSLKIIVYPGLKRLSKQDYELANPSILADADIVITTFPVLNNELYHSDNTFLESGKSLRYTKLYDVVPSPLDSIDWWRICLDEAQRVQGTAAAAAKMALRLKGQQRWCVTGTPIGRGKLDDLYGLLLFIGATPFQHKESFRHCLHGCHPGIEERIKNILYPIFWRSTKANPLVREQLGIPEQIEKKTLLEFSSIERHFYKKQLENTILAVNKPSNAKMKSDDISLRLHSLRAACCHPQVGSSGIHRLGPKKHNAIADRVLSMDQILDKLIDDARLKCEESQRICILHLNALACIAKLKVELKQWVDPPITIEESDEYLLNKSASLYLEALVLSDKNASPSDIIGEAELNGCETFLSPGAIIRDGVAILKWKLNITSEKQICEAKVEFNTGKKLIAFKARPLIVSPTNTSFDTVLIPKECVLQVSLASLGGIFVDVRRFSFKKTLDPETNWITFDSIRTNRSKLWRVLVESYHERKRSGGESSLAFLGIEIHLLEPSIGADDLQRMHILHNSALVVDSLIQSTSSSQNFDGTTSLLTFKAKLKEVNSELTTLESNYLGSAKSCHRTSLFHLERITMRQYELESELRQLSDSSRQILWRDMWWQDLLSWLHMDTGAIIPTSAKESLCFMVKNDLFELFNGPFDVGDSGFPEFGCVFGLQVALKSRRQRGYCEKSLLNEVSRLSENPSEGEILENSCCHKCRADWFQTGPKCRHCKLEEKIIKYESYVDDRVFLTIVRSISRWLTDLCSRPARRNEETTMFLRNVKERAMTYFKIIDCEKKELIAVKRHWRVHFDLLSDYDELNSCKSTMRLPKIDENIHALSKQELDRIVDPRNIPGLIMDHSSKQAGALAALRRDMSSLRYLKNQSVENVQSQDEKEAPTCPVCLMEFNAADRAVLKCGHSLHLKCIEEILKRKAGSNSIRCPMKCLTSTSKCEIMIAAADSLCKDDRSKTSRKIVGSWGTKVDRLLADLIDVINKGERCLVFSQWDDLLSIIESALSANNILFTHPKGAKMFGESVQTFRTSCQVMLLNVKRGAEGLTLVEATHVFMIEPLLHCGLDAQAINRVHRIGQTAKTYIHRYIIKDTIEEKIDAIRVERAITFENVEDEDSTVIASKMAKGKIQAGGLDGGFTTEELNDVLSTL